MMQRSSWPCQNTSTSAAMLQPSSIRHTPFAASCHIRGPCTCSGNHLGSCHLPEPHRCCQRPSQIRCTARTAAQNEGRARHPQAACEATNPLQFHRRRASGMRCVAAAAGGDQGGSGEAGGSKRVVILGGTGRVGSSTAVALLRLDPHLDIVVGSRSQESYQAAVKKRPDLKGAKFERVDIDDLESLKGALQNTAMVVHCAGPFQRKNESLVLEAAIATKTTYMDVCDDADYSQMLKGYSQQAQEAGVAAITSAGIYPGVSNLMAAHMVSIARREYDSEWNLKPRDDTATDIDDPQAPKALQGSAMEPTRVRYSYYTAGSGGVGPTILETSFLLAGTDVVVYRDGKKEMLEPITERRVVDFGAGIGEKPAWLYNLPEVYSTHKYLRVPSVSARFGTDPAIWNWAMIAVARLCSKEFLRDRSKIKWLGKLSMPWVTLVDPLAGEKVGMLVEVDLQDGTTAAGLFTHKYLNQSVGICTAAFVRAMLAGSTQPGVWFPEEPEAVSDRRTLLKEAAEGTMTFDLNKPLWQLGSDPKQFGMGLYF